MCLATAAPPYKFETPMVVFNNVDPWADDGKHLEQALAAADKQENVHWSRHSPSDLLDLHYGTTKIAWVDTVTVIPDEDGEFGWDSDRVCVNPYPTSMEQCGPAKTVLEQMWDFVNAGEFPMLKSITASL